MTQAEKVALTFAALERYQRLPFAERMAKVDTALFPPKLALKITRALYAQAQTKDEK